MINKLVRRPVHAPLTKATRRNKKQKNRLFSVESLERRELLAASPLGDEFVANDLTLGPQQTAANGLAGAIKPSGSFFVAHSGRGDTDSAGVFVRHFAASGMALANASRANETINGSQTEAAVASASNGNHYVVWQGAGVGDESGVFARYFSADGTPLSSEFRLNATIDGTQKNASVAIGANGSLLAAWQEEKVGTDGQVESRIVVGQYSADGTPLTGEISLANLGAQQTAPAIAANGHGQFAVAWQESASEDGGNILMQRFLANAKPDGGRVVVNTTTAGTQEDPSVALDDTGKAIVAWSGVGADDHNGIYLRQFGSDGLAMGPEARLNTNTASVQQEPAVSISESGRSVVTWSHLERGRESWQVRFRELDASGNPEGQERTANTTARGVQRTPSATMFATNSYLLSWTSAGRNGSPDAFARRYDGDAPTLSAALVNDTAPGGTTNSDGLTSDPRLAGSVSDLWAGVASLTAQVDGGTPAAVSIGTDGNFSFDPHLANDGTDDGPHVVRFTATDAVGNESTVGVSFELDTLPPAAFAISGPTGPTNNPSPTVFWETSADAAEYELLIATGAALLSPVDAVQGFFGLTTTSQALDPLADDTYHVAVTAADLAGNTRVADNQPISFTVDTVPPPAPEFDLDAASDSAPQGDFTTTFETVTLIGTTESGATVTLQPVGLTTTADGGSFTFENVSLALGDNVFTAEATDAAGNTSSTSRTLVHIAPDDGSLVLSENSGLVSEATAEVELGQTEGSRTLSFDVEATFDTSDAASLSGDVLSVYLVDPANPAQTLLDRGTPGTSLFTLTEDGPDYLPGLVGYDGSTVSIDVTSVTGVTTGILNFQLLGTDTDPGSQVTISEITNTFDPEGVASPVFSDDSSPAAVGGPIDLASTAATSQLKPILSNIRFDAAIGQYTAELSVENEGPAVGRQITVLFPGLPNGASLQTVSGTNADEAPYVSLRPAIPAGGLAEGSVSAPVEVVVSTPNLTPFSLTPTVLSGGPNRAPVLDPVAPPAVVPGDVVMVPLSAVDPDGDPVGFSISSSGALPNMGLEGGQLVIAPKPDDVGVYAFEVVASDGALRSRQPVSLTIEPDPLTTTRLSGTILNTKSEPLVGVRVELGGVETTTGTDGTFLLDFGAEAFPGDTLKVHGEELDGSLTYPFIAEKLPLVLEHGPFESVNNVIVRPIYLPALDVDGGTTITADQDTTVSQEIAPGNTAEVFVAANSLEDQAGNPYTGVLSITEVPRDLTPAALPPDRIPDTVVTIQPGEMVFTQPAPLTLPNRAGWEAGTEMDLWSINPETGRFDNVGTGRVTADGTAVETIEGGVRNSSWHFFTPPPQDATENPRNEDVECDPCKATAQSTSEVELHSGTVLETHELVSYQSMGTDRGVSLTYDSLRADPRPTLHFGYDDVVATSGQTLMGRLTVTRGALTMAAPGFELRTPQATDFEDTTVRGRLDPAEKIYDYTLEFSATAGQLLAIDNVRVITGGSNFIHVHLDTPDNTRLLDTTLSEGLARPIELPQTGTYNLTVSGDPGFETDFTFDLLEVSDLALSGGEHFFKPRADNIQAAMQVDLRDLPSGKYDYNLTTGLLRLTSTGFTGTTSSQRGRFWHVSTISSSVGAGWGLDGLQQIIENPDGTLLLIDGDGSELVYEPPVEADSPYESQPGDFSVVERLADGRFKRTLKDQTVYEFNADNKLELIRDRNGNETRYVYDGDGKLTKIVDPVGLETNFRYTDGRITAITDPANRVTSLAYDAQGNLVQITDPDGSTRTFRYDTTHHMTGETDKRGNEERTFYGFHGRAIRFVRKDGSELRLQPAQVQGLRRPDETTDPLDPPDAVSLGPAEVAYADANGNVTTTLLDQRGQRISSSDAVGPLPTAERDADTNLVTEVTDARGFTTSFTYDGQGNVKTVSDALTGGASGIRYPGKRLVVGNQPESIAIADLNGDGLHDLVTGNVSGDDVSVLLGTGHGTFTDERRLPVGRGPSSVAVSDLNGDGRQDLVTANRHSDDVSILFGIGDGTFNDEIRVSVGQNPHSLAVSDLDGDGSQDLATANQFSNDVSILLGIGDGTFTDDVRVPVGQSPLSLSASDLDGDGLQDLVTANFSDNDVTILLGNGDGTFADAGRLPVGELPWSIAISDLNSDGLEDLVTTNSNSDDASVLLGNGDGTFTGERRVTVGERPTALTVSDLNGDGRQDLLTGNVRSDDVSILLGNGDGAFTDERRMPVGHSLLSSAVSDLDGDGALDLVTTSFETAIISPGNGDGTFAVQSRVTVGNAPRSLAVSDLNGDGRQDLVTANQASDNVSIRLGIGDGTLTDETKVPVGDSPVSLAVSDLDDDGWQDLVTANWSSDDVSVLLGNEDGTFTAAGRLSVGTSPTSIAVSDLNGDGLQDLVTGNSNFEGNVTILLGNGDGTFTDQGELAVGQSPSSIAVSDLNDDGLQDLVTAHRHSDDVSVLLGNGDGTFTDAGRLPVGDSPRSIAVSDLDGDGLPDLVTANNASDDVSVLLNNEDGTFTEGGQLPVGERPTSIAVSDLNGDGLQDLVTGNNTFDGNVTVLLGNGDGTFTDQGELAVGRNPRSIAISDLNSDGLPDLLTANRGSDDVSLLFGAPGPSTGLGSQAKPIRFSYDSTFNQLASITDELGRQTLFEIDPQTGNTVSRIEVVGTVDTESGETDDLVTQFTYTELGRIDTITDPLGRVTDHDYDATGHLVTTTFAVGTPDEASQHFEYDVAGNVTAIVDENGNRTELAYDAAGRITQLTEADPDGAGPLPAPVTTFQYDAAGNLVATTDARSNTTQTVYDELNRPVEILDTQNNVTHFSYDQAGNLISVIDPLGAETRNRFDARDRLIETIDPDGGITQFRYDSDNNLTRVTDPAGNATDFAYDARNRLVREVDALGNDLLNDYDAVDNLIGRTDRNGRVTEFAYDDLDRLTEETWLNPDGSVANTIDYSYDRNSNLTSVTDVYSSLAFSYDNRDRVTTVDNADTPAAPEVLLQYAYDDVGNVLSVTDTINGSAGAATEYVYDALNRTTQLTQSGSRTSDKRVDIGYNQLGQFSSIDRFAGLGGNDLVVGTDYTYDALNRLTDLRHNNGSEDVAFYEFTYDADSRITSINDVDGLTTYAYDDRDQLTGAEREAGDVRGDESYAYDSNGNRISSHTHGGAYVTGEGNRLLSDGTFDYEYDDEGNLIKRTEIATGDFRELEWDHRNRLSAVTDREADGTRTQRVEFTYDALDRRISKSVDSTPEDAVDGVTTHFVYDREDVILDFVDADGAGPAEPGLDKRYFHGPAIDQVFAQEDSDGDNEWLLSDHLGTTRDLVDNDGVVANHIQYDSFGHVVSQSNETVSTRYLFTGRELDAETGLYYYRARYYEAVIGRFTGEDPIAFAGGDLNLFAYTSNTPAMLRDPFGLEGSQPSDNLDQGPPELPPLTERSVVVKDIVETADDIVTTAKDIAKKIDEARTIKTSNGDIKIDVGLEDFSSPGKGGSIGISCDSDVVTSAFDGLFN